MKWCESFGTWTWRPTSTNRFPLRRCERRDRKAIPTPGNEMDPQRPPQPALFSHAWPEQFPASRVNYLE
jgi:hypothetical protein